MGGSVTLQCLRRFRAMLHLQHFLHVLRRQHRPVRKLHALYAAPVVTVPVCILHRHAVIFTVVYHEVVALSPQTDVLRTDPLAEHDAVVLASCLAAFIVIDRVLPVTEVEDVRVVSVAAVKVVIARPACQDVIPVLAVEGIVPLPAVKVVVTISAVEPVVPFLSE